MTQSETRRTGLILRLFKVLFVLLILLAASAIPAFTFGLPAAARTRWARAQLEKVLARRAGTPVRIGSMRFSWKEGMVLQNLSIAPAVRKDVEIALDVREARIRPRIGNLLRGGRVRADVVLMGPDLRLQEHPAAAPAASLRLPRPCRHEVRIDALRIREGTLSLRSGRFGGILKMEGIELDGAAAFSRKKADVEVAKFDARVNGGTASATGLLGIAAGRAAFRIELTGSEVESNDLVARALRRVLPFFEVSPGGSARGRVDFQIRAEGEGPDLGAAFRAARGEGSFRVRDADLRGVRILAEAGRVLGNPAWAGSPLREAAGSLELRDGRLFVRGATARGADEIRLDGWTDPRGAMEFTVGPPGSAPARVKGTLEEPRAEPPTAADLPF